MQFQLSELLLLQFEFLRAAGLGWAGPPPPPPPPPPHGSDKIKINLSWDLELYAERSGILCCGMNANQKACTAVGVSS